MSPIPVGRLEPYSQWDQNMLDRLFDNALYPTGLEFERVDGYPKADGCVLLIPGRYWAERTDTINKKIKRYQWVLAMRTGDEADTFDVKLIRHPNLRWWVQTPRTDRSYPDGVRRFGVGFTPHFNDLPATPPTKDIDIFLAGQNTHDRRRKAFAVLGQMENAVSYPTPGFTEGMSPEDYRDYMLRTKVAPAPAGVFTPDSFRVYEALEAHAIPIADDISPVAIYKSQGYWNQTMGSPPFPILTDYENLKGWCKDALEPWPANANRITAWWMRKKRSYARWLREDLDALGALND